MQKIKLSVCIPVYNCADYIKEAIDSVLACSITEMELIVIDNCSTDATVEIVKQYVDPRLRLIQNESNIGMLGNWNKALDVVQGEFVKLLPADDFIYPGCLEQQMSILENDKQKKIALVCGRKMVIDDNGKKLFKRGFSKTDIQISGNEAINRTIRSGGNIIGEPGAVMFRKDIIEKSGRFDADIFYLLDLNMWFKMLLHGDLYAIGEVICAFRVSTVSESIKLINTQKRDVDHFINRSYKDKKYGVSSFSHRCGLINSFILSQAKKLVYKFVIK